ncbi:UDP-diphospho-muramoylpentapeptide beta-N- acetylglucosaminyltransferase [Bacillus coahuilensis p1.1.43]|uniref:UDP-N-acetylglucosamine--N-acetylmuramyl-(pentapeptide) pyrophosphoryl-undecaprenol N-acetylglucosamine transferase n=1 Tax=Bacillus coahuilensis p1.1.43 TaxID=1150625 RepID=A0A147K8E2_9BACI|nr:undecaprenyldiphospho-muramoylpentapeptide beta-N-acetylglucosaminyltransferase [Bacillus coahuilensis]KUP06463.1 UDP-diphospho-muramoylpentapeptide beta-N- acetylglucosaminyltransferase [Bacillus coahuilensis p1.1.43]
MSRTIVFTGGGSAGHVTVNTALIPFFKEKGWEIAYIGSKDGIEKTMIQEQFPDIPYYEISSGKLRRYFSWKNFSDPFKVGKGVWDAYRAIRKIKPDIVFSKGGFVTVPVIMASKMAGVPTLIHESDYTPGLANKMATPFASRIYTTFPEAINYLPSEKYRYIGAIIREELFKGDPSEGRRLLGFHEQKPILLIMGGSLGAQKINEAIRHNLHKLLEEYQIVHICGKGNIDSTLNDKGYKQFEFVQSELAHYISASDHVISRAGSNSIFEFLALRKPMILIPLSRQASRGDQILNADSFEKQGFAIKLEEENLSDESLLLALQKLMDSQKSMIEKMKVSKAALSVPEMYKKIDSHNKQ